MRGFSGPRGEPDQFSLGFLAGVGSAVLFAIVLRVASIVSQWGGVREGIEAVTAALTAPVLSMADLLGVVGVLLIIAVVVVGNRYMGGFSL